MPVEHQSRVAVVGAGVASLSAAYHLREHAHITLYECEDHLGGHAHTVEVEENGRKFGIDTAFVVFNEPAYPNLTAFFRELDVEAVEHPGASTSSTLTPASSTAPGSWSWRRTRSSAATRRSSSASGARPAASTPRAARTSCTRRPTCRSASTSTGAATAGSSATHT
ncbi:NAD(P)-binding protein [Streptomyces indonesiensis]